LFHESVDGIPSHGEAWYRGRNYERNLSGGEVTPLRDAHDRQRRDCKGNPLSDSVFDEVAEKTSEKKSR
jgi:hypothetical protein